MNISSAREWIDSVCAYDHCRVLLPWFSYARREAPLPRLRRKALSLGRADACAPGLALSLLGACLHAVRTLRETAFALQRHGRATRERLGVGRTRQLFGALYCALRHNLGPDNYFAFRLHARPLSEWGDFISHEECTRLLLSMRAGNDGPDIWGKNGWRKFCVANHIATVPILATAGPDGVEFSADPETLRGQDLFLKPDDDYSGRGGVLLTWEPETEAWRIEGAQQGFVPSAQLAAFLRTAGLSTPQVLQPRLRSCAELAGLSQRALVNARVLSCRDGDGRIIVLNATLRTPPADEVTSDVPGRTVLIPIDPGTGRLGCIHGADISLSGDERLPGNGKSIRGLSFPKWEQALELVKHAHAKVSWLPCVGWDLVSTDRGLLLLEGNIVWNARLGQQYGLCPIAQTPLAAALDAHLGAQAAERGVPSNTPTRA